jgi:predicted double-glycine peptidase
MSVKTFNLDRTDRAFLRGLILACYLAGPIAIIPTAWAADVNVGSGIRVDPPVKTMKDLRDEGVVKQRLDYSCGAAALATILRHGFGDDVTERDILVELFELLSEEEKKVSVKEGFSLLDLQRVAQARGYKAQGFRLEPQYLDKLKGPVIVFIEPRGYKHFAVLRGVRGDRVYLADPSRGNIRMPAYTFLESWLQEGGTGIIFVVEPKAGLPEDRTLLTLSEIDLPQPEIMTAREMLAVGNPFVRLPELSR